MDVMKQFDRSNKPKQTQNKNYLDLDRNPALLKEVLKTEEINRALNKIINALKQMFNRQSAIKSDTENILRCLQGFYSKGLKSQIPYLTPKTLYTLYKRGWTVEEIMNVSGYSHEDVIKKIKSYKDNSVDV